MSLNRRDFLKALGVGFGGMVVWGRGLFRAQGQPLVINQASGSSGIAGTVTDIVTGQPIADATVSVSGLTSTVTTDARGQFDLGLPPGVYEILVTAPGFLDMSRVHQEVGPSSLLVADFAMVPLNPTDEENKTIYEKLIASPQGPTEEALSSVEIRVQNGIAAITIPSTINVQMSDGKVVNMPLDEYVKGVVPAEMPASWPMEALKAQAVTARSYAAIYALAGATICTTSACQAYTSYRYASTNSAVDATSGQVITYNGNIVSTHYFSSCGANGTRNSEDAIYWKTCAPANWTKLEYERGKRCWGTHAPTTVGPCGYYGHGVGLCQWGASDRANEGWTYLQILTYYYTNIVVENVPSPPPSPVPISPANGQFIIIGTSVTISWSPSGGSGGTYYAEGQRVNGGWSSQFGWTSSTSWTVGALPPGMYQWRVRAQNAYGAGSFSTYYYFVVSDRVYKTYFPRMDKNSTSNW